MMTSALLLAIAITSGPFYTAAETHAPHDVGSVSAANPSSSAAAQAGPFFVSTGGGSSDTHREAIGPEATDSRPLPPPAELIMPLLARRQAAQHDDPTPPSAPAPDTEPAPRGLAHMCTQANCKPGCPCHQAMQPQAAAKVMPTAQAPAAQIGFPAATYTAPAVQYYTVPTYAAAQGGCVGGNCGVSYGTGVYTTAPVRTGPLRAVGRGLFGARVH